MRNIPDEIETPCSALNLVWKTYARTLLAQPGVLIPDTEDDLNWHAFLGHSVDMQGFPAGEFAGVDPLTKPAAFKSLKERGIGVRQLGELWEIDGIRNHLEQVTASKKGEPMPPTYEALERYGGDVGKSLAEALKTFPYKKGHKYVRALLENSAALRLYGYSFRTWLQRACAALGVEHFPPPDFRQLVEQGGRHLPLEDALRRKLDCFYLVGLTMAAYMLCDWQLWLWNEGETGWFATFKLDGLHEKFVREHGQGIVPEGEEAFVDWWRQYCPDLPPRLANECIWLGMKHKLV